MLKRHAYTATRYRTMDQPLVPQKLHELYPGRLLSKDEHFSGDNILHENHQAVLETRERDSAFTHAALAEEEALYRHLGGKDNIDRHPAVAPDEVVEDPALRTTTLFPVPDLRADDVKNAMPYTRTSDTPNLSRSDSPSQRPATLLLASTRPEYTNNTPRVLTGAFVILIVLTILLVASQR